MSISDLLPLTPTLFFEKEVDVVKAQDLSLRKCFKGATLFPQMEELIDESSFFKIAACWHDDGLCFAFEVNQPFVKSDYPDIERSDVIEILIDTRGLPKARIFHAFCHHFIILAAPNHETSALEVTRFRGDDRHELCDPKALIVEREFLAKSYKLKVTLPKVVLHGYDPSEFTQLKFAARIHRAGGEAGHFGPSSKEYQVMTTPMLWTHLNLRKK